jgi:pimeloyl-ACP methyl ester carboxylesterase
MEFLEAGPTGEPTMLFLHGAGVAGWVWEPQLDALSDRHLIVPDLPDHGGSRGEPFESIETVAQSLGRLINERAPTGPVHVIGHSLGAKIALELLRQDAVGARRVTTAIVASALVRRSLIAGLVANRALNRFSLALMGWRPLLRAQSRAMAFPSERMRERFRAGFAQVNFAAFMRPIEAFRRYDRIPDGMDAVRAPVLVLCGERELGSMRRSAADVARALPRAQAIVLDGADHLYPWKNAPVVNRLMIAWTTGAALPSGGGFRRLPRDSL